MTTAVQGLQQRMFTLQATTPVRTDIVGDTNHLVVPVVMLVEGVVNEQFISAQVLKDSASSWNGRPVVINHPNNGSRPISALDPRVLARIQVGTLFNARLEGNKLKADLWIDQEKVQTMSRETQDLIKRLEMGLPVEVSTGYFASVEMRRGTFQGDHFNEVDRRIFPDHLALLTDEQGACSWEDGCGAPRLNEAVVNNIKTSNKQKEDSMSQKLEAFKAPSVINSFKSPYDESEKTVARWYAKFAQRKLKTQVVREIQSFTAPPCILSSEEEK